MPTYVYKFVETGETIEVQQSFTDETLTEYVHPSTGVPMAVKKVFQPVGVTFKGDGFYKTDSRGKSTSGTSSTKASDTTSADSSGASTPAASTPSSDSGSSSTTSPSTAASTS